MWAFLAQVAAGGLAAPPPEAPAAAGPCLQPSPLHWPISTSAKDAQRAFDNGLAFLHSYVWHGAVRCLQTAIDLDPAQAVAHIELARTYLGKEDGEQAQRHAAQATQLAAAASLSEREKAWVRLGAQQVEAATAAAHLMPQQQAQYKAAIEEYIARFPDDAMGFVLRGNAESPRPDGRGQTGGPGSIYWYGKALEVDPDHFAARHFLIHSHENIGRYEDAVEHARHFVKTAPQIPHAHHMLAHVLPRLGRWQEALGILEKAHALHRESFAAGVVAPEDDWHYGHNLRLLAVVHFRLGNDKAAEKYLSELGRVDNGGHRSGYYCLPLAQYLNLRGRFEDALEHAEGCLEMTSPVAQVLGEVSAGEARLGLGKLAEAKASFSRASQAFQELSLSIDSTGSESIFLFIATLSLNSLDGQIALRDGRAEEGQAKLVAIANRLVSGRNFDSWASGLMHLEGLARDARRAGYPATAEAILQRLRRLDPGYEIPQPAAD